MFGSSCIRSKIQGSVTKVLDVIDFSLRIDPEADALRFAFRADSDIAQLSAIKAAFGLGFCQAPLTKKDPDLVRLLPETFDMKLGVWPAAAKSKNAGRPSLNRDSLFSKPRGGLAKGALELKAF
jgi:hypothetical protein